MQLLFPRPLLNEHMVINNQLFTKYEQINGYASTVVCHPWNMGNGGGKFRRRRSSHSVVANMDPAAVARRNERERNRVKQVNDGFDELRQRVPFLPEKKKLSKVEILRCAALYIKDLKDILEEYDCNNSSKNKRSNSECNSSNSGDEEDILSTDMLNLSTDQLLIKLENPIP